MNVAIKIQNYAPDTCTCVVQESWDDSLPADQVVYSLVSILHRGDEHAAIVDGSLFSVLYEENKRKNKAWNKAIEASGLASGRVVWSFNVARTLQLSFPQDNVSANIKAQIQLWCDSNLGVGKVVVL